MALSDGPDTFNKRFKDCSPITKVLAGGEKKQEDKLRHDTRCCDSCLPKSADWLEKRGESAVRAAVA